MNTALQNILAYLASHPEGCTSEEIAGKVLHLSAKSGEKAGLIVAALLKGEDAVRRDPNGRWRMESLLAFSPRLDSARVGFVAGQIARGRSAGLAEMACLIQDAEGRRCEFRAARQPGASDSPGRRGADAYFADLAAALDALRDCDVLVVWKRGGFWSAFRADGFVAGGLPEKALLEMSAVGWRALECARRPKPEELAAELGVIWREEESPADQTANLAALHNALLPRLEALGVVTVNEALELCRPRKKAVDFSRYAFTREFLEALPLTPGVYVMRDAEGETLYVGKSKRLRERVLGYFVDAEGRPKKETRLLRQLHSLEVHHTGSELGALLLEQELIESECPTANVQRIVHERDVPAHPERNFVLILPAPDPERLEAFLVPRDGPVSRLTFRRDLEDCETVMKSIAQVFFGASPEPGAVPADLAEANREIVLTWFARRRDEVDVVDVDQAGSPENAARLLQDLIRYGPDDKPGVRRI